MDKETIMQLLALLFAALVTLAGTFFGKLKIRYTEQAKYIKLIEDLTIASVKAVNNELVDRLKARGEFTKEKQQEALERALLKVNQQLNVTARKVLSEVYADVDKAIALMIESKVADVKVEKTGNSPLIVVNSAENGAKEAQNG